MDKLTKLKIKHNKIAFFPHFPHMPSLERLHFHGNRISYIGEEHLLNLTALKDLDLTGNRIEGFQHGPDFVQSDLTIIFRLNPWKCTCDNYLFVLEVRKLLIITLCYDLLIHKLRWKLLYYFVASLCHFCSYEKLFFNCYY